MFVLICNRPVIFQSRQWRYHQHGVLHIIKSQKIHADAWWYTRFGEICSSKRMRYSHRLMICQVCDLDKQKPHPVRMRFLLVEQDSRKSNQNLGFWRRASIFLALPLTSELVDLRVGNANLFSWLCLQKLGRVNLDSPPKKETTKTETQKGSILVVLGGPSRTRT